MDDASGSAGAAPGPGESEWLVPERAEPDSVAEHMARYRFAHPLVRDRVVLDCACGSGYGSAFLAEDATQVIGLDISPGALAEARERRPPHPSWAVQGDLLALPFLDQTFDLIISFETLEHVGDQVQALHELSRVLRRDGGVLVLSAPNRAIYREAYGRVNPYHVSEPTLAELEALLAGEFPVYRILGQRWSQGVLIGTNDDLPRLAPLPSPSTAVARGAAEGRGASAPPTTSDRADLLQAEYFVALCSFGPLPDVAGLLLVPEAGNVMWERTRWAQRVDAELAIAREQYREAVLRTEAAELEKSRAEQDRQQIHAELAEAYAHQADVLRRFLLVPRPRPLLHALLARLRRRQI
ncbi:MAG: class I SAM-dependent methyltransferase [Chloroflexi bacterium]|nr:class I SAM-dependent methyltransferase [Chloroflexota bacterium]